MTKAKTPPSKTSLHFRFNKTPHVNSSKLKIQTRVLLRNTSKIRLVREVLSLLFLCIRPDWVLRMCSHRVRIGMSRWGRICWCRSISIIVRSSQLKVWMWISLQVRWTRRNRYRRWVLRFRWRRYRDSNPGANC